MESEPSTAELKAAWQRGLLWRCGITYERAIAIPLLLRALRNDVLAQRKTHPGPMQGNLI